MPTQELQRDAAMQTELQADTPLAQEPAQNKQSENAKLYWQKNIRLILLLLVIWFAVSFGAGILLVDQLDQFSLGGYPLGFWFAEQGSIYAFVILIVVYTVRMNQIDRDFGVNED